jgi:ribosome-binding factor A|tara:strand:+ start:129 stop:524 length:396 start_codon:yes stop_codon:yes gene_type:complete
VILKRKTEKTNRSHKVSEIIRKAISEVLVKNELPLDTPFEFPINVVKVEMNSDLKIAYVYVVAHETIDETEIVLKLNSCKQYLSKEVTSLINLKFSPKLVFRNDKSINEISNIEKLLRSEKVLNDLKEIKS